MELGGRAQLSIWVAPENTLGGVDGYPPRFADDLRHFVSVPGALTAWVAEWDGAIVGHVALQRTSSPALMVLAGEATGRAPEGLGVVARLLVSSATAGRGSAAPSSVWRPRRHTPGSHLP